MEVMMMAKKSARAGRPSRRADAERKAVVVALKGSPEWKAWVDDLAVHCRTDLSKLVDLALVELAKSRGFNREAPQR